MKNIKILAIGAVLTMGLASCGDDYFDVDMEQNKTSETAFTSAKDVKNGMIGAYYALGNYRFYGRNVVAIGDMASDIAKADASSGHFVMFNTYQVTETDGDLEDTWNYGYKVIDRCVRTINGAEKLLEAGVTEDEEYSISSYLSQCYALRALATFTLTNLFGLPYQAGGANNQLGIILIKDKPFTNTDEVHRSTVAECYELVLSDIEKAKEYYTDESEMNGSAQFYFNMAAIYALEARVNLFMGNYAKAKEAAQNAIDERDSEGIEAAKYAGMWMSNAITAEDILTITKTSDDNLSANSLNTLYGSYGGSVSAYVSGLFGENDCRAAVLKYKQFKYVGLTGDKAVSNIPIFRLSEMYLILAECEARLGNIDEAKEALFFTAQRNADIDEADKLPATQDELLSFINDERVRELYLEGHRWFDARRQGLTIPVSTAATVVQFNIAKFVYPIPADEINAGFGTEQNTGWEDNLPK
jgi:tetratricopeptide (TPR) repeat protein